MSYATIADMTLRFERNDKELTRLTDAVNMPPTTIDTAAVQAALDDATAEMDSYLAQVYQMPLLGCAVPGTTPLQYKAPPMLVRICCDFARYNLYDERATDQVKELYKRWTDWLKDLVAGKAQLMCPAPPESTGGLAGVPVGNNPQINDGVHSCFEQRIFNRSTLSNYRLGGNGGGANGARGYRYGQNRGGMS
jgi:phage gp36-like protein